MSCHGNSLTQGQGASTPDVTDYPAVMRGLLNPGGSPLFTVTDNGFGGRTSAQLISEFDSVVGVLKNDWYSQNVVVMFEVRNSFIAFVSAETIIAEHITYCQNATAAGWKVIVCTAPGSDGTQAGENIPGEVNAYIRANWRDFADGFVDLEAAPEFSPSGDVLNPTHYSDGVHLTDAGYAVVAALVAAAVTELTGVFL